MVKDIFVLMVKGKLRHRRFCSDLQKMGSRVPGGGRECKHCDTGSLTEQHCLSLSLISNQIPLDIQPAIWDIGTHYCLWDFGTAMLDWLTNWFVYQLREMLYKRPQQKAYFTTPHWVAWVMFGQGTAKSQLLYCSVNIISIKQKMCGRKLVLFSLVALDCMLCSRRGWVGNEYSY